MSLYVRFDMEVKIDLPEGDTSTHGSAVGAHLRARAIEAALCGAFAGQNVAVYIDGEDESPAQVWIEVSEEDIIEVRCE